jgi:flagellar hook-length control protein FliK
MAEKSDAKSADAAQAGNSPSPAAAAVATTPTTFAKSASAAPGENISAISATSATDAGSPARLSDIQNIGNTSQTQTSTTATVRIGTLPGQTLPTQVPAMTIALQIARNLQKGINRFDIRLDPAEMGRIDVRMEVHRDGHVAAHLTVDRPETLDLLQRDARSLQQALSDAGLQANADSLNFSLRDQNASGNAPGFGANHANSSPASMPAAPNEGAAAGPVYNINLAANGGVDIRV